MHSRVREERGPGLLGKLWNHGPRMPCTCPSHLGDFRWVWQHKPVTAALGSVSKELGYMVWGLSQSNNNENNSNNNTNNDNNNGNSNNNGNNNNDNETTITMTTTMATITITMKQQ